MLVMVLIRQLEHTLQTKTHNTKWLNPLLYQVDLRQLLMSCLEFKHQYNHHHGQVIRYLHLIQ
jgi:hypothetical protein